MLVPGDANHSEMSYLETALKVEGPHSPSVVKSRHLRLSGRKKPETCGCLWEVFQHRQSTTRKDVTVQSTEQRKTRFPLHQIVTSCTARQQFPITPRIKASPSHHLQAPSDPISHHDCCFSSNDFLSRPFHVLFSLPEECSFLSFFRSLIKHHLFRDLF